MAILSGYLSVLDGFFRSHTLNLRVFPVAWFSHLADYHVRGNALQLTAHNCDFVPDPIHAETVSDEEAGEGAEVEA